MPSSSSSACKWYLKRCKIILAGEQLLIVVASPSISKKSRCERTQEKKTDEIKWESCCSQPWVKITVLTNSHMLQKNDVNSACFKAF